MIVLGLDIGSSSVKAGLLRDGGRLVGRVARAEFKTHYDGVRAEVDASAILRAVARAARGPAATNVDLIALSTMSPSWLAMDRRGRALTPVVTHQDRRSVEVAKELERRVGKRRHLAIAGNRPFPGGISSTTCAWFVRHERALMRRADLVGHLSTFLHRQLTSARVTDPSNASFMGVYRTHDMGGWSEELCDAVGISPKRLPDIRDSNELVSSLTRDAARRLGLRAGTPVMCGCVDTTAAMLLAGARPGRMVNVAGSTDVLALCTDRPVPHERLLTRALGTGRLWLSVATLAAAGSSLDWARQNLFPDVAWPRFSKMIARLAREKRDTGGVAFDAHLAGDRTSIEQPTAAFGGLTLATTRHDMLAAVVDALARASAERLDVLKSVNPVRIDSRVMTSGGAVEVARELLHRDWQGRWTFRFEDEATLRGLALLNPR